MVSHPPTPTASSAPAPISASMSIRCARSASCRTSPARRFPLAISAVNEDAMAAEWDAIIAGAGAAGLMAAIHVAARGRRVLLLEKGKKPGVKVLMSGGTRCNITHDCDARAIVAAFGPNGKFLYSALAALGPRETVEFFNGQGVAT